MQDIAVKLGDVRSRKQLTNYTCGIAALRSVMHFYGVAVSEQELVDSGDIGEEGTDFRTMRRLAHEYGFSFFSRNNASLEYVQHWLLRGVPVIACYQDWGPPSGNNGHYAVIIGIDNEYVTIADPANHVDGDGQKFAMTKRMELKNFLRRWFDMDGGIRAKHWCAVMQPLKKKKKSRKS